MLHTQRSVSKWLTAVVISNWFTHSHRWLLLLCYLLCRLCSSFYRDGSLSVFLSPKPIELLCTNTPNCADLIVFCKSKALTFCSKYFVVCKISACSLCCCCCYCAVEGVIKFTTPTARHLLGCHLHSLVSIISRTWAGSGLSFNPTRQASLYYCCCQFVCSLFY